VRKEVIGSATLYLGDCMAYMATLPDKHFALAIADPPYGINAANGAHSNLAHLGNKKWDEAIPDDVYFFELMRVSKNQVIWGGNYFFLPPARCFIFWDKHQMPPSYAHGEYAWTSFNENAKKWCGRTGDEVSVRNRCHPTQKPVKLYEWLLRNYAKPGDRILDTHGGSMSSVIAAINNGFEITCIEKDEDYFNAAVKRVNESQLQGKLFEEPSKPDAVQTEML